MLINTRKSNVDSLMFLISVIVISIVVGLAVSLSLFGAINYTLMAIIIASYVFISSKIYLKAVVDDNEVVDSSIYVMGVIALALLTGVFLHGQQFDYISIWGDLGVYVNQASYLRAGGVIPFSWQIQSVDIITNNPLPVPYGMVNPAGDGMYQFHGLPTWSAVMALSHFPGEGQSILSLLFAVNLILFYYVARDFTGNSRAALIVTVILASLPLMWHQALYATAEMLLLSITLSTYFLAKRLNYSPFILSSGLFAYGVVHMGVLILSPIFALILLMIASNSSRNVRKQTAKIGVFSGLSVVFSYHLSTDLSMEYSANITAAMFGEHKYLAYAASFMPAISVIPYVLRDILKLDAKMPRTAMYLFDKYFYIIARIVLLILAVVLAIQSYLIGWTEFYLPENTSPLSSWSARIAYINHGLSSLLHLSIVNIFFATAGIGLFAFILMPFIERLSSQVKMLWLFSLCFLLVMGFYRVDIPNNYYASRYFLPILVPSFLCLAAVWIGRKKALEYIVVPVVIVGMYYNTTLIKADFFHNEREVRDFLWENIVDASNVGVYGDDWIKYIIYPLLINKSVASVNNVSKDEKVENLIVVSEDGLVLGAESTCIEHTENRIPWQISYPTVPNFIQHEVCVHRLSNEAVSTYRYDNNSWAVGGRREFFIMSSAEEQEVNIEINSLGWWATKKPFVKDIRNLNPQLTVCGQEFKLVDISENVFVFTGVLLKSFCQASFETTTYIPIEHGDGSDKRALGADIYAISLIKI